MRRVLAVIRANLWATFISVAIALLAYGQIALSRQIEELRGSVLAQGSAPPGARARSAQGEPEVSGRVVSLDGAHRRGKSTARVALIEFSDFECPYCGAFARTTLPGIEREFIRSGRVLLAFWHLPLTRIHPRAVPAAEATECAAEQGRFWQMHDRLFTDQRQLTDLAFANHANVLGLDAEVFKACLAESSSAKIEEHLALGRSLGVTGTPTFFVGVVQSDGRVMLRKRISGSKPIQQFRDAINEVEQSLP